MTSWRILAACRVGSSPPCSAAAARALARLGSSSFAASADASSSRECARTASCSAICRCSSVRVASAPARRASSSARFAWAKATPPATIATTRSAPAPARSALQPAVRAPLALDVGLRRLPARVEELPLGGVELHLVVGGPLHGRGEARAAVEVARLAAALLPVADRPDEVEADLAAGRVLLQPGLEARPLAQQGLVGDLDVPFASGQEPRRGQPIEDLGDDRIAVRRPARRGRPFGGPAPSPRPVRPGAGAAPG